jgi:radical SAM protein with 4Fe4S-binding SPASM domain
MNKNKTLLNTPRTNELTAVLDREKFDQFPNGVITDRDKNRWKQFRSAYHKAQQLGDFTDFPLQLDFELNSTCQMKCRFCTHGQDRVPKVLLSFDNFKRAIDEGSRHGLCSIKMNYINEPLLNRDLHEYVAYARSRGVLNVYFATNGILLTQPIAQKLITAGVSKIMVSLDAVTPETFKLMRDSDQFDEIVQNIRNFIDLRNSLGLTHPLVRVNFLRTTVNAHEAESFVKQWTGVADTIGLQVQVGLPGVDDEFFDTKNLTNSFRCSFPFKLLVIDSGGNILPCCTFSGREMPLGHIQTMTLEGAWKSSQMSHLKTLHRKGDYALNPVCAHCINGTSNLTKVSKGDT